MKRADAFAELGFYEHSTGLREAALLLRPEKTDDVIGGRVNDMRPLRGRLRLCGNGRLFLSIVLRLFVGRLYIVFDRLDMGLGVMSRHGLGDVADARSPAEIASAVHAMYLRWKATGKPLGASGRGRDEFDVTRLAGVLAEHMRRLRSARVP